VFCRVPGCHGEGKRAFEKPTLKRFAFAVPSKQQYGVCPTNPPEQRRMDCERINGSVQG
jgi:hypothetical protein